MPWQRRSPPNNEDEAITGCQKDAAGGAPGTQFYGLEHLDRRTLMRTATLVPAIILTLAFGLAPMPGHAQDPPTEEKPAQEAVKQEALDAKVRAFLNARGRRWRDMNVPQADGQRLHDLIVDSYRTGRSTRPSVR